ncbi:MAG: LuxR C-terminal-related transcriptional regulator [Terracoccus sp.]
MTTSVVDQHWRDRHHPSALAPSRPSGRIPVGVVRVAQLQGVVMAVFGVSASAAVRELQWHSAQRNTSMADLAEDVMGLVSRRCAPMTPDVLGALLARQQTLGPERESDPRRPSYPRASVLHLVATAHPQATQDVPANSGESWRWERDSLTRREAQVLCLIGEGLSNQDIAAAIFVTVNTVKSYIRTAYRKIGVTSRAQAVRWALVHGERG